MMKVKVYVSTHLNLGRRLVQVGDKVLGACDGVTVNIAEATPEELVALQKAPIIKLVKPEEEESESKDQRADY